MFTAQTCKNLHLHSRASTLYYFLSFEIGLCLWSVLYLKLEVLYKCSTSGPGSSSDNWNP